MAEPVMAEPQAPPALPELAPAVPAPRLYLLHPLLVGPLPAWDAAFARVAGLGFDAALLAPIFAPGPSGNIFQLGDPGRAASDPGGAGRRGSDAGRTRRPRRKRPGWRFISTSCWTGSRPAARCTPPTRTGSRPRPRPARPTRARPRPSAAPPAPAGRSPRWPRRWAAGGRNGCAASPRPASPASAATCRPGCPTAIWRRLTAALPQARFLAWTAGVPAPGPAGPGRGRLRRGLRQPGLVGCRGVLAGRGGGAAGRHRPDHLDGRGALRPAPGRARRRCLDGGARGAAAPAAGGRDRRRAAGADGLRIRRPPAARCGARPARRLGLAAAAGELRPLGRAARRQCGDGGTAAGAGPSCGRCPAPARRSPPCCAPPRRMRAKPRRRPWSSPTPTCARGASVALSSLLPGTGGGFTRFRPRWPATERVAPPDGGAAARPRRGAAVRGRGAAADPAAGRSRPRGAAAEAACSPPRPPRIGIEAISPAVEDGRFPVKRIVGEVVEVDLRPDLRRPRQAGRRPAVAGGGRDGSGPSAG